MSFQGVPVPVGNTVGDGSGSITNLLTDLTGRLLPNPPNVQSPIGGDSGNQANAIATATLSGASGKTTWITHCIVGGLGAATAQLPLLRISGLHPNLAGGTMTFPIPVGIGTGAVVGPVSIPFNPPMPASGLNTSIVCAADSFGTGSASAHVTAVGFQI